MTTILILGVVLLAFASTYFRQDRYNTLQRNAEQVAQLTAFDIEITDDSYQINSNLIRTSYIILGSAIDADIYLVDAQGKTLICSDQTASCNHKTYLIDRDIMDVAMAGSYREIGTLKNIYDESHFSVGVPVVSPDGTVVGVVFASSEASTLTAFLMEITEMFALSSVAVIIIAFVIIYLATTSLVKPLKNMLGATESFSRGDFTVRVPVESYDELGRLSMAFNNMASSLALNESSRRSFIANVSHELKTPMTTIGGFVDGILDGTIPKEKHDHYLHIVSDEVKRLSRLVRSMLNIARIEAGEMSINSTAFDLNETVCTTVFIFEKAIDDKGIEIIGLDSGKIIVDADEDLIHQVVYNLIENAVKFTNNGGYIEVIYRLDKERNTTYIGIKNSGEGITKEEIPKLFDRFYKTDKSRSLDKSGVGLGLHIVRSIINLHNTDIIVKSVEGEYSEFGFYLPTHYIKSNTPLFTNNESQIKKPSD